MCCNTREEISCVATQGTFSTPESSCVTTRKTTFAATQEQHTRSLVLKRQKIARVASQETPCVANQGMPCVATTRISSVENRRSLMLQELDTNPRPEPPPPPPTTFSTSVFARCFLSPPTGAIPARDRKFHTHGAQRLPARLTLWLAN